MAANSIQFQSNLSMTDFLQQYGTLEQCREALLTLRWPNSFSCHKCSYHDVFVEQQFYQCKRCCHKGSLTDKTIFYRSKVPLTTWFLAVYLLTQSKRRLTIQKLAHALGVSYSTAWKLKHKIIRVNSLSDRFHY